jgi:hypothetical protein
MSARSSPLSDTAPQRTPRSARLQKKAVSTPDPPKDATPTYWWKEKQWELGEETVGQLKAYCAGARKPPTTPDCFVSLTYAQIKQPDGVRSTS